EPSGAAGARPGRRPPPPPPQAPPRGLPTHPPRLYERVHEAAPRPEGFPPRAVHLTAHPDEVALVLADPHLDRLRHDVPIGEQPRQTLADLAHGEAFHRDLVEKGEEHRARRLHRGQAREIGTARDVDLQHVARPHPIDGAGGGGRRSLGEECYERRGLEGNEHQCVRPKTSTSSWMSRPCVSFSNSSM